MLTYESIRVHSKVCICTLKQMNPAWPKAVPQIYSQTRRLPASLKDAADGPKLDILNNTKSESKPGYNFFELL